MTTTRRPLWLSLGASLRIVGDSYRLLFRHPILLVPMLWAYAAWTAMSLAWNLELRYRVPPLEQPLWIFSIILVAASLFSIAALTVLEMIEQRETGGSIQLGRAFRRALVPNTLRALPIIVGFALIWFLLNTLAALWGAGSKLVGLTARNARRELTEDDEPWFGYAHKALRMFVFTLLPAVAWEGRWAPTAFVRGVQVLREQTWRFIAGFFALEVAMGMMFFPLGLVLGHLDSRGVEVPPWGDWLIVAYVVVVASITLLLEQIYVAELYLWHLRWERAKIEAAARGQALPEIHHIPKPSLLDEVPDLTAALTP